MKRDAVEVLQNGGDPAQIETGDTWHRNKKKTVFVLKSLSDGSIGLRHEN